MTYKLWVHGVLIKLLGTHFEDSEGNIFYHGVRVVDGEYVAVPLSYIDNYTGEILY